MPSDWFNKELKGQWLGRKRLGRASQGQRGVWEEERQNSPARHRNSEMVKYGEEIGGVGWKKGNVTWPNVD